MQQMCEFGYEKRQPKLPLGSYVVDRLNDNFRFIHLADDLEFAHDYSRTSM